MDVHICKKRSGKLAMKQYRSMDKCDKEGLKGELLDGLNKIKVHSLYDFPSKKLPDQHAKRFGLCRDCAHLMLAASEKRVKVAACKELRIRLNSSEPVTECSYYASDETLVDVHDYMMTAALIDIEDVKKVGF